MEPLFALIFGLILPGLSEAMDYEACYTLCGPGSRGDNPVLYRHGPGRWSPHPEGTIVPWDSKNKGPSGRAGEDIGNIGGGDFGSFTGNVKAEWETKFGLDAEIEAEINSHREHEQLIMLENGGYIKDKDGTNWGLKTVIKPSFVTQVKLKGELGFGGRRRRRRRSAPTPSIA